jgi:hypothetical protein
MKHEKHPWFIRDSNPVPVDQKSGALTTELPGHLGEGEYLNFQIPEQIKEIVANI